MKYKMSVLERILTLNLLPKEGNVVTLRVTRDMQTKLSFSEQEIKDWKINSAPNGQVMWDNEKAKEKEIEIGDAAMGIIKLALKKLDEDKKLTPQTLIIFEKFIGNEQITEKEE